MDKRNLALIIVALIILAGGAGYYLWVKGKVPDISNTVNEGKVASQDGTSFFDTFFEKLKPSNKQGQSNLKEYKDVSGIFSINYPPSWVMHNEKGRLLSGVSLTPPELLNQYSAEEQLFVKGLVVAAAESGETPEVYYKNLGSGSETGEIEAGNTTVNGYPAYMVKGLINGISYKVYIVSHNNHIVYFNYRTKEDQSAHQNDIKKTIDFGPYVADFEAAVASVRFLK